MNLLFIDGYVIFFVLFFVLTTNNSSKNKKIIFAFIYRKLKGQFTQE